MGMRSTMLMELRLIKQFLCYDWMVCIQYIPREHNKVVDSMAKLSKGNYNEIHVFKECPSVLTELLKGDLHPIVLIDN